MVALKKWLPAILGGLLFFVIMIGFVFCSFMSADDYVRCTSEMDEPGILTVLDGNVVGNITCINTTRIPVEFRNLDAQLFIDNREVEYKINGLAYGDIFEGGRPKEADVIIKMEPVGLVQIGLKFITGDDLTANLQGSVSLAIYGIEFTVPINQNVIVD